SPIDQCSFVDTRINTGRRLPIVLDPGIECVKQRSQIGAVVSRVNLVLRDAAFVWISRRAVLRAAERVNPDAAGYLDVFSSKRIGMHEGTAPMPVLGGALRVHDLRQPFTVQRRGLAQDQIVSLRNGIGGSAIRKREVVSRIKMFLMLAIVPGRLSEPVIEETQAAACDMR